jgi:hypothetical protein
LPNEFTMAPVKAMKAMNVTKAMKKAAKQAVKNHLVESSLHYIEEQAADDIVELTMKKAAKAIKNAQGNNWKVNKVNKVTKAKKVNKVTMKTAKKVNKVKKAKKSKKADAGMGFEVLLTVCRECKEAVEIVRCLADLQVMTLTEYYCRQGCTTCLELHAVLIK